MHLLRPFLSSQVQDQAPQWAQQLSNDPCVQAEGSLDNEQPLSERPWAVLGQLTRKLWHLHCRRQLGIATSVLCYQVGPTNGHVDSLATSSAAC